MKINFETIESMLDWLKGKEEKYEVYITKLTNEVVATPNVSTRPVRIGTCKYKTSIKELQTKINNTLPNLKSISVVEEVDYQVEK